MTETSSRPIDEFASAIYDSARLAESAAAETLIIQYRDKLTELAALRESHEHFAAFCTGRSPTTPIEPLPSNAELSSAFHDACNLLSGEALSKLAPADLYRQLDQQLRRLCQHLAKVFFVRLEMELEEGRVGEFHSSSEKMGRCTLPANARGRQFDLPLVAMMRELDDEADDRDRRPSNVIQFIIDQNIPLDGERRLLRRFRPVQLVVDQATAPIRKFLRFVSGTRFRETNGLAHGRFNAIVFFHYVVDSWDEEALRSPARAQGDVRRPLPITSRLGTSIGSVALLTCLFVLTVSLLLLDRNRQMQIADLQNRIARLESAQAPEFTLHDHKNEFAELLRETLPSTDRLAEPVLVERIQCVAASPVLQAASSDDYWPENTTERDSQLSNIERGRENRLSLLEQRVLVIHARLDAYALRDDLEKIRTELLSKLKSIHPSTSAAASHTDARNQLAGFAHDVTGGDATVELDSKTLSKAILAALRNKLEMPEIVESRMRSIRSSQSYSDINSKETFSAIEKEATRICEDLDVNVPAVFKAVVLREKQQLKGGIKK